ncbi:MAG: nuclear transport factor 2 family protein [Actinomycetota bacterium]
MRFRRAEWDVPMPAALRTYWDVWNAEDLDGIRPLIDACTNEQIEWVDPRDHFVGRDEFEACVRRLKESKPNYRFEVVSAIDAHHDRLRYRWNMFSRGRVLMEGLDVVTLDDDGRLAVVEGFFGHPTPLTPGDSA